MEYTRSTSSKRSTNRESYVNTSDKVNMFYLNYLAFQSFDLSIPDEGYSRNVLCALIFNLYVFVKFKSK